jgi:DNA-binding transcriptional LysR family regulator
MELHQVRYFLALAGTLSFTRAAEISNVTQPALTKAIQKLEYEFGGELVYRERRNTQLTELGRRVLPMLRQTLICADEAREISRDLRRQTVAPLRIGLTPTVSAALLSGPLAAVAHMLPGLQVDLVEAHGEAMTDALIACEIHAGIGTVGEAPGGRIDQWRLFEERYVVAAREDHPIAAVDIAPLSLVREAVWLERLGCEIAGAFRAACFDPGEGPKVGHRAAREEQLQHMALAGLGIFLAPEHAALLSGLVARPLEADCLRRCIGLRVVSGRRYSPALESFIRIARRWSWPAAPEALIPLSDDRRPPVLRVVG